MTIWVNEQIDPCGIVYSCLACRDEFSARECHVTWNNNLTPQEKEEGWRNILRTVKSWDDVPVNALKLSY